MDSLKFIIRVDTDRDILWRYCRDSLHRYTDRADSTKLVLIRKDIVNNCTLTQHEHTINDPMGYFYWTPSIGNQVLNVVLDGVWNDSTFVSEVTGRPKVGYDLYTISILTKYIHISNMVTDVEYDISIDILANSSIHYIVHPFLTYITTHMIEGAEENCRRLLQAVTDDIQHRQQNRQQ